MNYQETDETDIVQDHLQGKFNHAWRVLDDIAISPRKRQKTISSSDEAAVKKRHTANEGRQDKEIRLDDPDTQMTIESVPTTPAITSLAASTPGTSTPATTASASTTPTKPTPVKSRESEKTWGGGFFRSLNPDAIVQAVTIQKINVEDIEASQNVYMEELYSIPGTAGLSAYDALRVKNRLARRMEREKGNGMAGIEFDIDYLFEE